MADLYGQGLYGSGIIVIGCRTTGGSSGSAQLRLLYTTGLRTCGSSLATAGVVRRRRASVNTQGSSITAVACIRRRQLTARTTGTSSALLLSSVRIRHFRLATVGSSTGRVRLGLCTVRGWSRREAAGAGHHCFISLCRLRSGRSALDHGPVRHSPRISGSPAGLRINSSERSS
jgi:hypothetical protein